MYVADSGGGSNHILTVFNYVATKHLPIDLWFKPAHKN